MENFARNHELAFCALWLLVWMVALAAALWPFSWQRLGDRFPFILSIANLALEMAVMDLPKAFRGTFEVFLGHSIYEMRFTKSGNIETGWQWINRWEGHVGSLFFWGIVLGGIWGLINLIRGRARITSGLAVAVAVLISVYLNFFLSAL
jgi:hypothetical protein